MKEYGRVLNHSIESSPEDFKEKAGIQQEYAEEKLVPELSRNAETTKG